MPSYHLDLGCGYAPKNPYNAEVVFGVDIYPEVVNLGSDFKCANLAIDHIPFEDCLFDSVSAFDVLEHIPRQAIDFEGRLIRTPFIDLMNDIYRVLKPNGMFYAYTPAFPAAEAFQDPTHVNFITAETHSYFCGEDAYARRYGFVGNFEAVEVRRLHGNYATRSDRGWKIIMKNWRNNHIKGGLSLQGKLSHLVWQLKAIK